MVTHERAGRGTPLPSRRHTLSTVRRIAGPVTGLLLPVALTFLLNPGVARDRLNLTSEALLFLLTVVGVACIGGVVSAVIASVTASLLLNYWFIPPVGQFTLDDPNALLAVVVFAVVAATVAAVVDRSLRLSRRSACATAEAETMSSLAGTIVRGGATIPALVERTRETFGMDSAELVDEAPGEDGVTAVPAGPGAFLVLRGRTLPSSERRVLTGAEPCRPRPRAIGGRTERSEGRAPCAARGSHTHPQQPSDLAEELGIGPAPRAGRAAVGSGPGRRERPNGPAARTRRQESPHDAAAGNPEFRKSCRDDTTGAQSQPLRLKPRWMTTQAVAMTARTRG
jgi:hypothetical protein